MEPFEIIAAPFTAWIAPVGEAFPAINATPAGNWAMIGTSGDLNYSEDGVTVAHTQTTNTQRVLGSTGPRKAFRTAEDLLIRFRLLDISLEQYAHALNGNAVATTAAGVGTAGFKAVSTYQGQKVSSFALLVKGSVSPEGEGASADWHTQYEVPVCFQSGSPEPVFVKGEAAGIALEFMALEDPNAASAAERFGRLVTQHQDPLP